jgi:hypothetical protein
MGGSSSGDPTTMPYVKDAHKAISVGMDADDRSWDDMDGGTPPATNRALNLEDDYADHPSMARYIYEEGLSSGNLGNPYDGVSAYDPTSNIATMESQLTSFIASFTSLDEGTDVPTWLGLADTAAEGDIDSLDVSALMETVVTAARRQAGDAVADALTAAANANSDDIIERARANFEVRARRDYLREVNGFNAGMAAGGAVQTSAFVIGTALLVRGFDDRLATFDAEFSQQMTQRAFEAFLAAFRDVAVQTLTNEVRDHAEENRQKATYILQATQLIVETMRQRTGLEQSAVELTAETNRVAVVARGEQYEKDLEYDERYVLWDAEQYQRAANVYSAVSGGVMSPSTSKSRVSSAIGGALGGAAKGGTVAGPWGAVAGGIAGGLAGALE